MDHPDARGSEIERPMVRNGQIVVRKMMNLSSSFDHRVVDGYDAAAFIQRVKGLLEHPAALFIERIAGSYSGIMGLPLFETGELLEAIGARG